MYLLNSIVCSGVEIDLILPSFVSSVFKLVTIIIPIILIIMGVVDLFKAFVSVDDNDMKMAIKKFTSRIIYCVVIFLLPVIITAILNILIIDKQDFSCVRCFIQGECSNVINDKPGNSDGDSENGDKEESSGESENDGQEDSDGDSESDGQDDSSGDSESDGQDDSDGQNGKEEPENSENESDSGKDKEEDAPPGVSQPEFENIEVEKLEYDMKVGEKVNCNNLLNFNEHDKTNIIYTSSNSKIVSIDTSGNITALNEGTATIKVKSNTKESNIDIFVAPLNEVIPVKSIKIDSNISLKVGETEQLIPVITPSDATNQEVKFTSDDTKIVKVNSSGMITAVSPGTAHVYAKTKDQDKTAIATVTVSAKEILIEKIKLNEKSTSIKIGQTYQIKTTIEPKNANNKNLTYSSSNEKIAKVSSKGVITGKAAGTATITIKNKASNKTAKFTVKVVESHKIHFIKLSSFGDCILLESNGKYGLIDAGRISDYKIIKNYLDSLGVDKLDFLLLTHNHGDHVGSATKIINKYKPTKLYTKRYHGNDFKGATGGADEEYLAKNWDRYNSFIAAAKNKGTKIVYLEDKKEGYKFTLNEMVLKNYNLTNHMAKGGSYAKKTSENVNCIMTLVEINGLKIYLTSDVSTNKVADPIAKKIGKVDVYKLIHHGHGNGTSLEEAGYVNPDYAIITNSKEKVKYWNENDGGDAVARIKKYTKSKNIYYSVENTVIVDCTSGKVKIKTVK